MFAAIAFVVVALTTVLELAGVWLAPLAALVLGALAGRQASSYGRSAVKAGLAVGAAALLGAVVGLAVPGLFAGMVPSVQDMVRASEPHPEARIPVSLIAPMGGLAGGLVGLILGLVNLVLAAVGGLIGGVLSVRRAAA
jgi:hypothetical protein